MIFIYTKDRIMSSSFIVFDFGKYVITKLYVKLIKMYAAYTVLCSFHIVYNSHKNVLYF